MMHRVSEIAAKMVLVSVLLFGCAGSQKKAEASKMRVVDLGDELTIREIAEDVFVVEHRFPWPANSLLVRVSSEQFVFADTPYTPEATGAVIEWLRGVFKDAEVIEINTGYHVDNLGGNEYLLGAKIPVHGTTLTARLLETKGEDTRAQILKWLASPEQSVFRDVHASMEFFPPDHLFEAQDTLAFRFAGERVEVFYPGPSHAEDNMVVFFENRRILFGGCMVKSLEAEDLGFTGDADILKWPAAVERVMERYKEAEIVVPGHGEPGGRELLKHTLHLLEASGAID